MDVPTYARIGVLASFAGTCFLLTACQGTVFQPGERTDEERRERREVSCDSTLPGPELRRLSHEQYRNTLRDLFGGQLGVDLAGRASFPTTRITGGFTNDAAANHVNEVESNRIEDNAAELATYLADDIDSRLPMVMTCVTAPVTDTQIDGCIDSFITDFGSRAFRRPISDEESTAVRSLYDATRDQGARVAWTSVMEFFLQAPPVIYQVERGAERIDDDQVRLSSYEVATRLSYFIWNTMPDAELLEAANADALSTPEQVEDQARRMLEDPRALDSLITFHRDLTRSYRIGTESIEDPAFSVAVRTALEAETRLHIVAADARGDLTFSGLFDTNQFVVDPALAEIYGVGVPGSEPVEVTLEDRRGLLSTASVLTSIAHDAGKNETVMRGLFILEEILCQSSPPFPDNVDVNAVLASSPVTATARDRLQPTLTGDCASCHTAINPPGFALENYDYLGRYRTDEGGATIDASGIVALGTEDVRFADGIEFLEAVAESEVALQCYARQWFRFAVGREESASDECAIADVTDRLIESGGDIRELMVEITRTDAFRNRVIRENE